jgi:hypothetical protein
MVYELSGNRDRSIDVQWNRPYNIRSKHTISQSRNPALLDIMLHITEDKAT